MNGLYHKQQIKSASLMVFKNVKCKSMDNLTEILNIIKVLTKKLEQIEHRLKKIEYRLELLKDKIYTVEEREFSDRDIRW